MAGESVLAKLAIQIVANNAQFVKGVSESNKALASFTGNITKIAGTLGLAFGIKEIASFGIEAAKLAGEFEGVKNAFDRLEGSKRLMGDLREATHSTVSELDLMKRTVQAANFGISLAALPKLLEFATLRAQQTGQSVDYLVDSIVTGIGRKSPLILDNLGISAVALRDKLGGVSIAAADVGTVAEAVGKIAEEELVNMGKYSDNTASKFQQLTAAWDNFKVSLGSTETGIFSNILGDITEVLKAFGTANDRAEVELSTLAKIIKEVGYPTDRMLERLKEIRQELGTPIDFNINQIRDQFKLTEEQAQIFQQTISDVNKSLSEQELRTKIFQDFARGYKDVNEAAEAFKNIQYETITALQAEEDANLRAQKVDEDAAPLIQDKIDGIRTEINERYKLIESLNEYIKTLAKSGEINNTVGIIQQLEDRSKELGEAIKAATSVKEIRTLQAELRGVKTELDKLLSPKEFNPITIPIDLDFTKSVDFQESINQQLLDARFTNPITIPIEVEIDPESTEEADRVADSLRVKWENTASAFEAVTRSIENSVASAIQGQLNFAQALIGITLDIVDLYLKQALAAAIAKAIQSGGPLPVGLALAGIGVTAVKALFSKNIGSSGSGGGGGGSSVAASAQNSNRVTSAEGFFGGGEIRLVASGPDLVGVIRENNFRGNRTRGG